MNTEKIISLKNVSKHYPVGDGQFTALKNINLNFQKGEFAGLVGPSGSGENNSVEYYWLAGQPFGRRSFGVG